MRIIILLAGRAQDISEELKEESTPSQEQIIKRKRSSDLD